MPLSVVYLGGLAIDFFALRSIAHDQLRLQATQKAQLRASQFNEEFAAAAQVAKATAAYLTAISDVSRAELDALVRANVEQNPLVYGSCVAFEPSAFDPQTRLLAPYAYRADGDIRVMDIGRDAYDYTTDEWEWYQAPRASDRLEWTEPYFDQGAGNILMCTCSVPFFKNGRLLGVATIDLPIEQLRGQVGTASPDDPFVLLSPTGRYISHPDPSYIMKETVYTVADRTKTPELAELFTEMSRDRVESGVARLPTFGTPEPYWVSFARIDSTGWYFAAAVPEAVVMAPLRAQMRDGILVRLAGMGVILTIVLIVAVGITGPIKQLAQSVAQVAHGNFDAKITNVRTRDEVGTVARAFNAMLDELKAHVAALTKATAEREAVESELRIARKIQASMLPRTFPPFPDRKEFELHAINVAAKKVAGDFFDFFFLSEKTLAIVLADVSGKGVPAALFMAMTRTLLRNLSELNVPPGEVLERTNRTLVENNDQMMFVTLFLGHYDLNTGVLRFANAGHNPPYRIVQGGEVIAFADATGLPLGFDAAATYGEGEIRLEVGDAIVLFTDGVTEAHAPSGEMFGEERWEAMLAARAKDSMKQLCDGVVIALEEYQNNDASDDLTLLAMRRRE